MSEFQPDGGFSYPFRIPGATIPFDPDISAHDIAGIAAAIQPAEQQNVVRALSEARVIDATFFRPISAALADVQTALRNLDGPKARAAATAADDLFYAKQTGHQETFQADLQLTRLYLGQTGKTGALGAFSASFFQYADELKESVAQSQAVPGQIDTAIISNLKPAVSNDVLSLNQIAADLASPPAGIQLLNIAARYTGDPYVSHGMDCSRLVALAAKNANIPIPDVPLGIPHSTPYWFAHGLGDNFTQLAGGSGGVTLARLIDAEINGSITLPPGAVIVADSDIPGAEGHAALFEAVLKMNDQHRMIVFDANGYPKWYSLSLDTGQTAEPDDVLADELEFPGHCVGPHLVGFQWAMSHRVKVFQPRQPPPARTPRPLTVY
jgi:hypothetical protein